MGGDGVHVAPEIVMRQERVNLAKGLGGSAGYWPYRYGLVFFKTAMVQRYRTVSLLHFNTRPMLCAHPIAAAAPAPRPCAAPALALPCPARPCSSRD